MPPDERWSRIVTIFGDAIELPPSQRPAYVELACANDSAIRAEVERLLALHAESAEFLEPPALDASPSAPHARLSPGTRVGRYVIERHIATGGMGIVFEARQESPSRRVALKMVHPSLVSPETLRRLSIESEALARLRHPGIAQIYEAGTHDFGDGAQPFIAMELIDGVPLLAHAASLDVPARVGLLAEIAKAVQHAHEKGVLHRDLKPANILVDSDGRPRVLDFGVARLVDVDGAKTIARTVTRTESGSVVGTIQYMSPEQLHGEAGDVDTRSDIYSFGVVAYEVLAGRMPFDLPSHSLAAVVQAVCRQDFIPLGRAAPALQGDLEWIVMKAMAPERARRYASAQEFADDLSRFLAHAPISARPPTTFYQLRKFARRNRALVAGVGATIGALAIGMLLYANEASRARAAAKSATDAASKSAAVNEFLTRMLARVDPNRRSDTVDLRQLVDGASAEINSLFADKPIEQAAVRNEVGTIYYNLGRFGDAEREYRAAMELRTASLGAKHAETLDATNNLGQALASLGQRDEAIEQYRRALEGRREVLGATHPRTLNTMNNIAMLLDAKGQPAEAETMLREAVAARTAGGGPLDEDTLIAMGNLAGIVRRQDRFDEALELRRRAADGFVALYGQDHRLTAIAQSGLARSLHEAKRFDEAEAAFRTSLAGLAVSRGGHDHDTGVVAFRYGELLEDLKRHAEAVDQFALARSIEVDLRGRDHRNVLRMGVREGENLREGGELERARILFASLIESFDGKLPQTDIYLLDAQQGLARTLVSQGRDAEAEPLLRAGIDRCAAATKPDLRRWSALRADLASLCDRAGRAAEAAELRTPVGK